MRLPSGRREPSYGSEFGQITRVRLRTGSASAFGPSATPIPGEGEPGIAPARPADEDDLPIRLESHVEGQVATRCEVGPHLAVAAEGRVERSARVVACQRESASSHPGGNDLPRRLDSDAESDFGLSGEAGRHFAVAAERDIRRSVGVVASQGESGCASAGGDDLAVRLDDEVVGGVVVPGRKREVRRYFPALAEGRIERSVGLIAGEAEFAVGRQPLSYPTGNDDLPVSLEGDC